MATKQYWIGAIAVVDWPLTELDGTPVDDATVTGTVTLPDGTTTPMTVTAPGSGSGDPYRATYEPTTAGLHAYRVVSTGSVDDADEGTFVVLRSRVGAPPITTDPSTTLGRIRLLIPDLDEVSPLFTDGQINAFYLMEASNVRLAAAQALDTAASNEVMVSKVIRTLDLQTDGSKVSADLRARAAALRAQAGDYDNDGNLFAFDVVDFRPDRWWLGNHELEERRCD